MMENTSRSLEQSSIPQPIVYLLIALLLSLPTQDARAQNQDSCVGAVGDQKSKTYPHGAIGTGLDGNTYYCQSGEWHQSAAYCKGQLQGDPAGTLYPSGTEGVGVDSFTYTCSDSGDWIGGIFGEEKNDYEHTNRLETIGEIILMTIILTVLKITLLSMLESSMKQLNISKLFQNSSDNRERGLKRDLDRNPIIFIVGACFFIPIAENLIYFLTPFLLYETLSSITLSILSESVAFWTLAVTLAYQFALDHGVHVKGNELIPHPTYILGALFYMAIIGLSKDITTGFIISVLVHSLSNALGITVLSLNLDPDSSNDNSIQSIST